MRTESKIRKSLPITQVPKFAETLVWNRACYIRETNSIDRHRTNSVPSKDAWMLTHRKI
jgi:hypothetical protein